MGFLMSSSEPIESTDFFAPCCDLDDRAAMMSITLLGASVRCLLFLSVSSSSFFLCTCACLMVSARSPKGAGSTKAWALGVLDSMLADSALGDRPKKEDHRETGLAGLALSVDEAAELML